jgi:hypothetical protein
MLPLYVIGSWTFFCSVAEVLADDAKSVNAILSLTILLIMLNPLFYGAFLCCAGSITVQCVVLSVSYLLVAAGNRCRELDTIFWITLVSLVYTGLGLTRL